jgi:hypothetical protein
VGVAGRASKHLRCLGERKVCEQEKAKDGTHGDPI